MHKGSNFLVKGNKGWFKEASQIIFSLPMTKKIADYPLDYFF